MNHIAITHNPFLIETVFTINGQAPSESSNISGYCTKRLQLWVEQIFFDFRDFFNGANQFHLEFTGVESDFIDIQQAAEKATQQGMTIELHFHPVAPAEDRLEKITQLMARVENTPKFAEYLEKSGTEAQSDFREALNNDFDAYVIATMSSGKSTFINAMLGQDLLPAANEATTATIVHIYDDKSRGNNFLGKRIARDGEIIEIREAIDLDTMKNWNQDPDTKTIKLWGDILAVEHNDNVRLVLTDTPGPNNAQDKEHERTTTGFVQDSLRNPLIIYVLNATQLGTNDDSILLRLVAEIMSKGGKQSKDRFLFVVNKMDMFDPEGGENVEETLQRVREYLNENGIQDPNIYPVSARMAYLLRKQSELTKKERNDKHSIGELLLDEPSMALPQYMPLSPRVARAMEAKATSRELLNSGLPAVEAVIDEYISKYSFPMRLNRANLALTTAIERGMQEADLMKQLEIDECELDRVMTEISLLKARRDKGFNTQAYKEKIIHEGRDLPLDIQDSLNAMEANVRGVINELGDDFVGDSTPTLAQNKLEQAAKHVEFTFNRTINEYEQAFQNSQVQIKADLHEEYLNHIASLFPDSRTLELPIFKSLKKSIATIALNIDLNDEDVSSRSEVTGHRTVSDSSWYNPFSWGRTREVEVRSEVEYVDLSEIWKERMIAISSHFDALKYSAIKRIQDDKNKLIDNYLGFLDAEFTVRFDGILDDLNQKAANKEQREAAIYQAKAELEEINKVKQELEAILQF
jgi:ribosome biogenesis GTPase A